MKEVKTIGKYKYYWEKDHYELYNVYGILIGRFTTEKAIKEFYEILELQDLLNKIPEDRVR